MEIATTCSCLRELEYTDFPPLSLHRLFWRTSFLPFLSPNQQCRITEETMNCHVPEQSSWALPFLLNLCRLTYVHLCMPVVPLVPSDSPTLISSLLRLSAHHLALTASASRPATASRPSNPLNPSPLAPEIRLC